MNNVKQNVALLSKFILDLVEYKGLKCLSPENEKLLRYASQYPSETFSTALVFGKGGNVCAILIDLQLASVERVGTTETLTYKFSFMVSWDRTIDALNVAVDRIMFIGTVAALAKRIETYVRRLRPTTKTRDHGQNITLQ